MERIKNPSFQVSRLYFLWNLLVIYFFTVCVSSMGVSDLLYCRPPFILYSWFARDVTAAMLVVKNKSISHLWELNSIFI